MARGSPLPDPATELRLTTLHATRGANYWSSRPVTRMDLEVGAYDEISSAEVPGLPEALERAMPGLVEHRCSVGERGGFLLRLRRGTYAPHVIEHVALELQLMIGHDVGYGRTRGGESRGEYTLVFEHAHEGVGLRAAALALDVVQRAFAGRLATVEHEVAELRALAATPDVPPVRQRVLCGVTGGDGRAAARDEICRRRGGCAELVVDVAPSSILQAGLPYSCSDAAVILDAAPTDVPERYRDPERAQRLVSVVADAVRRGGVVVAPAKEWEVQDLARDAGCRVAIFSPRDDITPRDWKVARAAAWAADDGRILIEAAGDVRDGGRLHGDASAAAQVAAALAVFTLDEPSPPANGGGARRDDTGPAEEEMDAARS